MRSHRVGLIDASSKNIPFSDIQAAAQALQTQADRDFTPIWGIHAQILPFDKGEPVPRAVWLMSIVESADGGLGIHLDKNHRPFAKIMPTSDWPVTASHEMLEMLVDPLGHKFIQGPDIDPATDG